MVDVSAKPETRRIARASGGCGSSKCHCSKSRAASPATGNAAAKRPETALRGGNFKAKHDRRSAVATARDRGTINGWHATAHDAPHGRRDSASQLAEIA